MVILDSRVSSVLQHRPCCSRSCREKVRDAVSGIIWPVSWVHGAQGLAYEATEGDEVEDLFQLLAFARTQIPDLEAVSSGAIASDYQRLRVEQVCHRAVHVFTASHLLRPTPSLRWKRVLAKTVMLCETGEPCRPPAPAYLPLPSGTGTATHLHARARVGVWVWVWVCCMLQGKAEAVGPAGPGVREAGPGVAGLPVAPAAGASAVPHDSIRPRGRPGEECGHGPEPAPPPGPLPLRHALHPALPAQVPLPACRASLDHGQGTGGGDC